MLLVLPAELSTCNDRLKAILVAKETSQVCGQDCPLHDHKDLRLRWQHVRVKSPSNLTKRGSTAAGMEAASSPSCTPAQQDVRRCCVPGAAAEPESG